MKRSKTNEDLILERNAKIRRSLELAAIDLVKKFTLSDPTKAGKGVTALMNAVEALNEAEDIVFEDDAS
jgi:hypothetical protein